MGTINWTWRNRSLYLIRERRKPERKFLSSTPFHHFSSVKTVSHTGGHGQKKDESKSSRKHLCRQTILGYMRDRTIVSGGWWGFFQALCLRLAPSLHFFQSWWRHSSLLILRSTKFSIFVPHCWDTAEEKGTCVFTARQACRSETKTNLLPDILAASLLVS